MAASNTRVVGALIAHFVNLICETFSTTNSQFHLIGHSLGAHIMGYAGKKLYNPKVSRITGLDPAGPGFTEDNPLSRLHYLDATKVDIIHSDIAEYLLQGLGLKDAIGNVDFYPNGGKLQPGCPATSGFINLVTSVVTNVDISCSHSRSHSLARFLGQIF